jgi:hypothetical protein
LHAAAERGVAVAALAAAVELALVAVVEHE